MQDNHSEKPLVKYNDKGVPRIGGWLRLLAIGLVSMVVVGLGSLAECFFHFSEAGEYGLDLVGPFLLFKAVGGVGVILGGAWLCFLFFKKRASFVKKYIVIRVVVLLFDFVYVGWLSTLVFLMPNDKLYMSVRLLGGLAATVVWIIYLRKSRRAKETFVL